jgi:hypothetical protein
MKRVGFFERIIVAALVILAGAAVSTPALGQEEAGQVTSLDLGFDTEQPGHEVIMPLILDLPEGVEVGTVVSQITFPTQQLSFAEVTAGLSAQAAGAEVTAVEGVDDQNPENTVITVTVSTGGGGAIPGGMLADLIFTISEDAFLEVSVTLENAVSAFTTDDPPRPVEAITGKAGEILVTATPPVFACFFYMH